MMKIILALILLSTSSVFAAPGVEEPVADNVKDPTSLSGMCTSRNSEKYNMASGECQTILEQLSTNECTHKALEQLRLRYLGDAEEMKKAGLKNTSSVNLPFSCKGQNTEAKPAQDLTEIAKDPKRFEQIMMQFFAAIASEESGWTSLYNGKDSQANAVRCDGDHCGLLGLKKEDMEKPKYACGCDYVKGNDSYKLDDPTMDSHLNLRCGVTMALLEATDDKNPTSVLNGGDAKDPVTGKDTRSGFAKIFKSLENNDDQNKGQKYDTPLKRIQGKMDTFCKTEAFATGETDKWNRTLEDTKGADDVQSGSGTTK